MYILSMMKKKLRVHILKLVMICDILIEERREKRCEEKLNGWIGNTEDHHTKELSVSGRLYKRQGVCR